MHMTFILGGILLVIGAALLVSRFEKRDRNNATNIVGIALIALAAVFIVSSFIRIVPAGTVGVYDLFGRVKDAERLPGLNFVNPFAKLQIMNIKTEEIKEVMVVPSQEGLSINVDVSILYRMLPEKASDIYTTVGQGYRGIVIIPQFRSVVRGATVDYEAKALYTSNREEIAGRIKDDLRDLLAERGIVLENVLLRAIQLPPTVGGAIEQKLKAEQEAEQMRFILDKERKEAERRIIEAEGIAKSQEIINKTLTQEYLQHEAIQSQMKMANSPNNTVIYIPVGTNGIPLVKMTDTN